MTKQDMTEMILAAKKARGLTWEKLAKKLELGPVYLASCCYGENSMAASVIQEQFGDGIMSAIDFTLDITRKEDPKGERVLVVMDGKFLPYKKW